MYRNRDRKTESYILDQHIDKIFNYIGKDHVNITAWTWSYK